MKTIYITLSFLLISTSCFSMQSKDSTISFFDTLLFSKAKYTNFPRNMFDLFSKDKHLEIKIQGDILDNKNVQILGVFFIDSNSNIKKFSTLWRSQKAYTCEWKIKRKMERSKQAQKQERYFIEKKKNYYTLTFPLRKKFNDGISGAAYGYRMEKGTYFLYIEYKDTTGKEYTTKKVKVIFK